MTKSFAIQKVLLVLNSPEDRSLDEALRHYCPEAEIVTVSVSGKDVREMPRGRFDAVFADGLFSVKDLSLLSELKKHETVTPIIVIVKKGKEIIAAEAIKKGAYDYLVRAPW